MCTDISRACGRQRRQTKDLALKSDTGYKYNEPEAKQSKYIYIKVNWYANSVKANLTNCRGCKQKKIKQNTKTTTTKNACI